MLIQLVTPDNYTFTIHAVASLIVGMASIILGLYVLIRERGSLIGMLFWLFTVCAGLWLEGFGMTYASLQPGPASYWIKLAEIGVNFIPAGVLALTVAIAQQTYRYGMLVKAGLVVSALFCIEALTTKLHVKGMYHYFWGYYPEFGPLGGVFLLYFFGVMVFILNMYRLEYQRTTDTRRKKRMLWMLTAFSFAYLASFDFLAAFGVPLYPFGYVPVIIFIAITAFVILRYRLVDITPELAVGRIFEALRGAVIVVDLDNRIRVANRGASGILGQSNENLDGADLASVIELPEELRGYAGFRDGDVHEHAMNWVNREGRRMDLEISAAPLMDRDKTPAGVVYIMNDVTERTRAEQKIKQYAEDLKQSNEDVLTFAYIVSHDLRAPLVSIKGFTSELRYSLEEIDEVLQKCLAHVDDKERDRFSTVYQKDVREAMGFIGSSVSRMDGMITSLLTLSRMGRRELNREPIDMTALVRSILDSLAHQVETKRVRVMVGELPVVVADRSSMEQVMGNLLDNALKYLEPGRDGTLEIRAEQGPEEAVFMVRDNGRGIARDDIHLVFELFRRAGKQDVPGEGMGLAYVKTIIKRHNGRIWCESNPGEGTMFSFTIPHETEAE